MHAWDPHRLMPEKVVGKFMLPISMQRLLCSLSAAMDLISLSTVAWAVPAMLALVEWRSM